MASQVSQEYLQKHHEQELWNMVYYFNEFSLPFDLILPYENDIDHQLLLQYRIENKKELIKIK